MDRYEVLQLVRAEIARQVNVILHAQTGATIGVEKAAVGDVFPGMPPTTRPVAHPYGLVSRAPAGIPAVLGRVGEHIANRIILLHRDPNRPADIEEGETVLYNQFGQQIRMEDGDVVVVRNGGDIHLGSKQSANPVLLGDVVQACLSATLAAIAEHTHIDSIGGSTWPPTNAATFTTQQSSPVDDGTILSDHVFTEK